MHYVDISLAGYVCFVLVVKQNVFSVIIDNLKRKKVLLTIKIGPEFDISETRNILLHS